MHYIFDMDGTLIDSMPTFGGAVIEILDRNKVKYPDDIIKIITPLGYGGTAEYAVKELGCSLSVDEIVKQMMDDMFYAYKNNIPAKEGVEEALKFLKSKGHSLNVLTASPHYTVDPCLKRLGIYDLFDNVWSCEDFNTTKSDPEIYRMAAERLGTTVSECVFLDDNINAVRTAKIAGMRVIGVYDKSSEDLADEMKDAADRYIYSFQEIGDV